MRLRLNFFIIVALLFSSLTALSSEDDLSQDPTIFGSQQNNCQFAGTFKQIRQLDGLDQGLSSSGVFYHHCQQGVIWSTLTPTLETLVMRRDGIGFIINDTAQKQLKSRQGKFLSSLLNSLMSGDQKAIEKQFEVTTLAAGAVTLTPKKRSLKRAIKTIEVKKSPDNKNVDITIVDRSFQKTHINSIQTKLFDGEVTAGATAENCSAAMTEDFLSKTDGSLAVDSSSPPEQNGCEQLLLNDTDNQPKQKS